MKVKDLIQTPLKIKKKNRVTVVDSDMPVYINGEKIEIEELDEAVRQYDIEKLIGNMGRETMFFVNNGLKGPSVFESGLCYEFALGLYNFLKSKGEKPELVFLVGNMKKAEAQWYKTEDFDPSTEHPFHTVVKIRKHYYDINGRLGTKRQIVSMWPKFRRKKLVITDTKSVKKYIKKTKVVKELEKLFSDNYNTLI